uniref:TBC1 domain family member 31 n=1 Tax=Albugo laibachii Nc14 TaxID=890382 RepID=F0WJH6_9STRA|nr:conserved hypothetical protein [Albugo laibachii Nc14]|eukprot:CCA21425.1 conserved hypothetical protein [Albugo laibachii Nc14]
MESGKTTTVEEWIHWIAMENEIVLETLRSSPSSSTDLTWSDAFSTERENLFVPNSSNASDFVTLCDGYKAMDDGFCSSETDRSVDCELVEQICAPVEYLNRCCSQDVAIQVLRNELQQKQDDLAKSIEERENCRAESEKMRFDMDRADHIASNLKCLTDTRQFKLSENEQNEELHWERHHQFNQHVSWAIDRAHPRIASPETSTYRGLSTLTSSSFDISRPKTWGFHTLPQRSRFDCESIYHDAEGKQNFWMSQYQQAIRWRSSASDRSLLSSPHSRKNKTVAKMEIFTHPRVKNRGHCSIDEKIPHTRYIGISGYYSENNRESITTSEMVKSFQLEAIQNGIFWTRKPVVSCNGLVSCHRNVPYSTMDKRPSQFRSVTFNIAGDVLAATDEKGRVFVFYLTRNRYELVQHIGKPTITSSFNPKQKYELLVTCENEMARCIDVHSMDLISTLKGHRFPPICASFQRSGNLALTGSLDAVILWQTTDWSRFRILNAGPGVEDVIFVSQGELIAVLFQDATIMMWELESLALKYRFCLPSHEKPTTLKSISVSEDHKVLLASGQASSIFTWNVENQAISRIIELPEDLSHIIKHVFLPGHRNILTILSDSGKILFLNVASRKPRIKLEIAHREKRFTSFSIENKGTYLAASTSDGCLLLYDLVVARGTARKIKYVREKEGLLSLEALRPVHVRSQSQAELSKALESKVTGTNSSLDIESLGKPEERPVHSTLINHVFGAQGKSHRAEDKQNQHSRNGLIAKTLNPSAKATPTASIRNRKSKNPFMNVDQVRLSTTKQATMNRKRLKSILRCYGRYPNKYRLLAWRFLLDLPSNFEAFQSLLSKGPHPILNQVRESYPIRDNRLSRRFCRIMSALIYWCPAFGEATSLAAIVYPFVKLLKSDDLAAFEISMTFLLHWCGSYLVNLPQPPIKLLSVMERELKKLDPQLFDHFSNLGVGAEIYGWSLLQTIFTEVVAGDEWQCLWDHLITGAERPHLFVSAALAYNLYFRTALLRGKDQFSIHQYYHQQNPLQMDKLIQLMHNLDQQIDQEAASNALLYSVNSTACGVGKTNKFALPKGQYPAFTNYPKLVVDMKIKERQQIASEEAEIAEKRSLLDRLRKESKELEFKHSEWLKEKQTMQEAEDIRRKEMYKAEKERVISLRALDQETRKLRLERLQKMEETAQQTLDESLKRMKDEVVRLQEEFDSHHERIKYEISFRKETEELKRIEFETEKRITDIQQQLQSEERVQRLRQEYITRAKHQELVDLQNFGNWKREDEREEKQVTDKLSKYEHDVLESQEHAIRQTLEDKYVDHILIKEKGLQKIAADRKLRQNVDNSTRVTEKNGRGQEKSDNNEQSEKLIRDISKVRKDEHAIIPASEDTRAKKEVSAQVDLEGREQIQSIEELSENSHHIPPSGPTCSSRAQYDSLDFDTAGKVSRKSSAESNSSEFDPRRERAAEEIAILKQALDDVSSSLSDEHSVVDGKLETAAKMRELGHPMNSSGNSSAICFTQPNSPKLTSNMSEFETLRRKAYFLLHQEQESISSSNEAQGSDYSTRDGNRNDFENSHLQRPIEQLEGAIDLDSLDDHESMQSQNGCEFDSFDDSDDEDISDDRSSLLERARKILRQQVTQDS